MKLTETKTLNAALKSHYSEKKLSASQLEQLLFLQAKASFSDDDMISSDHATHQKEDAKEATSGFWSQFINRVQRLMQKYRYAFASGVTAILFALAISLNHFQAIPTTQSILEEIAFNHKQRMSVTIKTASITEVSHFLEDLSFSLIKSSRLDKKSWSLIGGRYCSINGTLAAQLKVKNNESNKIYTFYQAALPKDLSLDSNATGTNNIDGINVSIWKENGLLLALADD